MIDKEGNEFEGLKPQAAFDIFMHARLDGLLQFLAQASDVVVAAGQPGEIGTERTYPLYLEGTTTIEGVLRQAADDRAGWIVDETRAIRAMAPDRRVYHLSPSGRWRGRVARGSAEMLGQMVEYRGELRVVESVDFQPRGGDVDAGLPGSGERCGAGPDAGGGDDGCAGGARRLGSI